MRALLLMLAAGCTAPTEAEPWTLVWEDTFDGAEGSPPDPANWVHDVGGDGWGNDQLEFNTDRTDNASLDGNGFLRITARQEDYEGNAYTSARLTTLNKVSTGYGRIEARILLPEGKGLWPAFWMLGTDFPDVGWPACGEIDIMEYRGDTPNEVISTIHGPGSGGRVYSGGSRVLDESLAGDFHVFAVEWDPGHLTFFVDDQLVETIHAGDFGGLWVFDHEFFLILNLAVGGNFLANPDETTSFPAVMGVDWVRIWERTTPVGPVEP